MACGRCGNNNRPNTVPSTVSGGRPGASSPRPGSPAVVSSGQPTVRPSIKEQIGSLRYVPNSK